MDPALRNAFCTTLYRFNAPDGELMLRVDMPNSALNRVLLRHGADSAAVITAFNPHGNMQPLPVNRKAQELLRSELSTGGFTALPGRNEDPAGQWPTEESFLVLGINRDDARALAARHNQLAFLWMDAASATPLLIETAAPD